MKEQGPPRASCRTAVQLVVAEELAPGSGPSLRYFLNGNDACSLCRSSFEYGNADFSFFVPCPPRPPSRDILSQLRVHPDELRAQM